MICTPKKLLVTTGFLTALLISAAGPPGAVAQLCLNTSDYFDLSDDGISFPTCRDDVMTCQTPVLGTPVYTPQPDCDPTWQPCGVKVEVPVTFPGNHQNDPSLTGFTYSFGHLVLHNEAGIAIDACGVAGAVIERDHGIFRHTKSPPCGLARANPVLFQQKLIAKMCPCAPNVPVCPWAACEKQAEVMLEYFLSAVACPPKSECCDGDSCTACKKIGSGGMSTTGDTAGMCNANTGPGAKLNYIAGGSGSPQLPGATAWRTTLGRGWSHDYAERLVRDPDDHRVWLITRFGSFREFRDMDRNGGYEYVSPSDEKRQLRRTGMGWELTALDGTVQGYDHSGRWQSTLDRHGSVKTATYGSGGLVRVDLPDGRHERFTYHASGKLAEIVEVGVDGVSTRTWAYVWTSDDLSEILRPDGTRWRYRYEDPRHPGYMTQSILVAADGSERLETAWEYDAAGRAVRIWKGDVMPGPNGPLPGPNAVEVWSLSFTQKDSLGLVTESVVTDPLGQPTTYTLGRDAVSAKPRVHKITGDCSTCGLGPNSQLFYDDPANPLLPTRSVSGLDEQLSGSRVGASPPWPDSGLTTGGQPTCENFTSRDRTVGWRPPYYYASSSCSS